MEVNTFELLSSKLIVIVFMLTVGGSKKLHGHFMFLGPLTKFVDPPTESGEC